MKEQERIELLKAVAECAPPYMGATTPYGGIGVYSIAVEFRGIDSGFIDGYGDDRVMELDLTEDDIYNSQPIIAMLDAMEKARDDMYVSMFSHPANGDRTYSCAVCNEDATDVNVRGVGTTRAEAVSKAFVAVFGGEK